MDINLENDTTALVGIKSENPEITGSENLNLNMEIPMDQTSVKVTFKYTSTVASSVVAQEKLNAIARDNINFLGSKIAEGIQYFVDNAYYWANRIHEIQKLQKEWRQEERNDTTAEE